MKMRFPAKKTIAVVLLLISFIMLFLPWISLSVYVMGQKLTISDLIQLSGVYEEYTSYELESEIYYSLQDLSEDMAYEGVYMDPDQAMRMIKIVADGQLSPISSARVLSFLSDISNQMKNYLSYNMDEFYGEEMIIASMIINAAGKVTAAAVAMWILVISAALTFILAIYFLKKDKKFATVPYFATSTVLLIVFIVFVSAVNNSLNKVASEFSSAVSFMLSFAGINGLPEQKIRILHMSASGFISVILAAAALFAVESKGLLAYTSVPLPTGKWRCPTCGREISNKYTYCNVCGTRRDDLLSCKKCGRKMVAGTAFCPYCGAPSGTSGPEVYLSAMKACPRCGKKVGAGLKLCPYCGNDFEKKTELMGTLLRPSEDDL